MREIAFMSINNVIKMLSLDKKLVVIMHQFIYNLSLVVRKPVFGVSDQVRHKPGCTTIEDG